MSRRSSLWVIKLEEMKLQMDQSVSSTIAIGCALFKPIYFGDEALTEKVYQSPFITFTLSDPSGQAISEIDTPQASLLSEAVTEVRPIIFQKVGQKDCYDFRRLIGVNARKDVSCAWAAFEIMARWMMTGIYQNDEMDAMHIDAYLLSEKLQSPRFGNAIMREILAQMPKTKGDGTLADNIRRMFDEGVKNSLLKKLYLDTAIWWFPPNTFLMGTRNPRYFEGAGFLNSNDGYWLGELEKHKRETCLCPPTKKRKVHIQWDEKDFGAGDDVLSCQVAPWLDNSTRYYSI